MTITSLGFLAFVGILLFIYWFVPHKAQWVVLLIGSLIFYLLNVRPYTLIYILISVGAVYLATRYFEKSEDVRKKRAVLVVALLVNVGLLVALKYTNMLIGTVNKFISGKALSTVDWLAPMAISYYTLTLIAYLVDCYGGMFAPEHNFLKLTLYTIYFPVMVSGPICRYKEVGEQLFRENRFDYDRVLSGMRRTLWGLLKKLVVADHIAMIVNVLFGDPEMFSGPWIIVSACAFMVQLFFDFSGCMDIVLGVSKCFGIILPENFNTPFLSRSVQEFWNRWHITLGGWLKDYVMFPLSRTKVFKKSSRALKVKWGRNAQKIPSYVAMLVVWTLMGIWHGNSWKYVIGEGWYFWLLIVLGQMFEPASKALKAKLHIDNDNIIWRAFQVWRTFLLVSLGNIAFRAESLAKTFHMFAKMFDWRRLASNLVTQIRTLHIGISGFGGVKILVVVAILGLIQIMCDIRQYAGKSNQILVTERPLLIRWAIYYVAVFTMLFMSAMTSSAFMYFQF